MSRYVIACGGTGGHLAPGIAIAEVLQQDGHDCLLIVSEKQVDSRLIKKYPSLHCEALASSPFKVTPSGIAHFAVKNIQGIRRMIGILRARDTDLVVAFGGFLSLPVIIAARVVGIPFVLHEANRKPGKVTRLFKKSAKRIYLPRGLWMRGISADVIRDYGFPVRREFRRIAKEVSRERLGLPRDGKVLTILGGSQGAQSLNTWARDHFETLAEMHVHLYCVTGIGQGTSGVFERRLSDQGSVFAHFVPFTDKMAEVMSASDLVITRAGAGTIAELTRSRVPSILIPYPYAADDHQDANARFHEQQGGGIVLKQTRLDQLLHEVEDLLFNDWLLTKFQKNLALLDDQHALSKTKRDLELLVSSKNNLSEIGSKSSDRREVAAL
ncbi:MAG: UDP-N-acetylglucosamine--N-acetylmuramyl-(pentapeptide) pyrophosphoryl-undecaprenol N-acetylglucosamine transferase [Verrucomicrobiota bacterium]